MKKCVHTLLLLLLSHVSHVQFCATPKTAAHQAPPSLGFSRQEHCTGLPLPSPQTHCWLISKQEQGFLGALIWDLWITVHGHFWETFICMWVAQLHAHMWFHLVYFVLTALSLHCCVPAFSSQDEQRLLSNCSMQASHCCGFSCCRAQALECKGFSSCSFWSWQLQFLGCRAAAQQLWHTGLVTP